MNLPLILTIVLVVILTAVIVIQHNKFKLISLQTQKTQADLSEKEQLLKKEALISAKEALQAEQEKINDEFRERRQEIARI